MISVNTKLICLLGTPLDQSLSPKMHNNVYEKLGLDYYYFPVDVAQAEDLPVLLAAIRKMNFAGFAITKPYKIDILSYVDQIDPLAQMIGSSNTVVRSADGKLTAYNTDGMGFAESLMEAVGRDLSARTLFALGAGGAARAGTFTVVSQGLKKLYVTDVRADAAQSLAEDLKQRTDAQVILVDYQDSQAMSRAMGDSNVVLNATGVGMIPHLGESPVDAGMLRKELFCCDMIYNPPKSKFLEDAERAGCGIMNGYEMFLRQGAAQVKLWTGHEVSLAQMDEALK